MTPMPKSESYGFISKAIHRKYFFTSILRSTQKVFGNRSKKIFHLIQCFNNVASFVYLDVLTFINYEYRLNFMCEQLPCRIEETEA